MRNGIELIAEERQRQLEKEAWTPDHDSNHNCEELVHAAKCYATAAIANSYSKRNITYTGYRPGEEAPNAWPWEKRWWKPSADPIRNLVKAGALIAAEIDRLQNNKS
ncbi:hypothetical protein I2I11_04050 [Pontibacter sp. 172403-2]|uniref:hypothetical protein n=1 Tax=Pontibacter rufus TaxID=2791028 RepID=UPI0018AFB276|nr:hypothetical protein [Pontibacter sp. 172403-2]MBF9252456.1 hypothetical protein [Pontibacter sp. 172403-2]